MNAWGEVKRIILTRAGYESPRSELSQRTTNRPAIVGLHYQAASPDVRYV
jgi:hypothetical protein